MINFNVPPFTGKEFDYMKQAVEAQKICGDGQFTKKCNEWIEKKTENSKVAYIKVIVSPVICGIIFLWAVSYIILGAHNPFIYFNF